MSNAPANRPVGIRERNKHAKRLRIAEAARRLFVSFGYDDTTVRMIAQEADVGWGTVFAYATDKRDLLFLAINDDLAVAWREAEAEALTFAALMPQLRALFTRLYRFFGAEPALARYVLRELQFYQATDEATRFEAVRDNTVQLVARLIVQAVQAGELREGLDIPQAARLTFAIYQAEIRRWLTGEALDVEEGTDSLVAGLEMLMQGLRASPS